MAPSITPTVAAIPSLTPTPGLVTGFLMPTTTPALPDAVITADNLDKLRMLRTIGSGGLVDASVAPAGRLLAVATTAGLALFELPQMALIRFTPRTIAHVVVGPHGQLLVADHDLIRIADGVHLTVLEGQHPRFSPDGTLLAVGDEAGAVRLLQVSDQQLTGTLQVGAKVTSLTFSPDGSLLAVQREDGLVQIWHLGDAASLTTLAGAADDRLVITADNQLIITGGQGGVTFYRLHDGQLLYHLDGAVDDLAIGPRRRLLALLRGGQVQLWGVGP
jgi:hypothetical protein